MGANKKRKRNKIKHKIPKVVDTKNSNGAVSSQQSAVSSQQSALGNMQPVVGLL